MKRSLFTLSMMLLIMSGCIREDLGDAENTPVFVAETEEFDARTKTSLSSNYTVVWSTGDLLSIFQGGSIADKYQVKAESAGSTNGKFSIIKNQGGSVDGDFTGGTEVSFDANVAIYPYGDNHSCNPVYDDSDRVTAYQINGVMIPSVQQYSLNSFPEESFLMVALTNGMSDHTLKFKNVCGGLKLQLKGNVVVERIELKGNADEALAGNARVTVYADGSVPSISLTGNASRTVVLECGGVALNEEQATTFIMTVPPTAFAEGFTITITGSDGNKKELTTTKSNSVTRSNILAMPEITVDFTLPAPEGLDYIDEYGINHGKGVNIDGVIWAPVNCGYYPTGFEYGKLYQWGRKYGQGYEGYLVKNGPVSIYAGNESTNANVCFVSMTSNWYKEDYDNWWNLGDDSEPVKSEYDPCPEGWRIPIYSELDGLRKNRSSWIDENGMSGYFFSGKKTYSSEVSQIFFPVGGYNSLSYDYNDIYYNSGYGEYWASNGSLFFNKNSVRMSTYSMGGHSGYSIRCVQDDVEMIPVSEIRLDKTSLSLEKDETYTLLAEILPSDANHQSLTWYSEDESVAKVTPEGKVTAVFYGKTKVIAFAGLKVVECDVTVPFNEKDIAENDLIDYVQDGENYGKGTIINGIVWAPVNCWDGDEGWCYYQWGSPFGLWSGIRAVKGPVSSAGYQFVAWDRANGDWYTPNYDNPQWGGSPCPEGWRVPSSLELEILSQHYSDWTEKDGEEGIWFSGLSQYSDDLPRVFMPACGFLSPKIFDDNKETDPEVRAYAYSYGGYGYYWSATSESGLSWCMAFDYGLTVQMMNAERAYGFTIRCVQDL